MKGRIGIACGLCLLTAGVVVADKNLAPAKGDPRAAALMEESAKTRYTWDFDVTAVSGKVAWEAGGSSGSATFQSVLRQRGGFTIKGEGDAPVPSEVKDHVGSLISHRTPPAPAAKEQQPASYAIVVEDESRGPLILTLGDAMQSSQRVKEGKLVQVNRTMGGKRFTIDVTEFENAPGRRFCPSAFTVSWYDAKTGKKVETQAYTTQGFNLIEGQLFPKAEKVTTDKQGKNSVLELTYSDIKFTKGQAAGGQ
jgi:hypothetical protein